MLGVLGTLLAVVLQVRQARGGARDPRAARARQLALACLLFTATAVVLLLSQDLVEFSWRYQLPAVITLPPAGILGVSALLALRRNGTGPARGDGAEPSPAAAAAPASTGLDGGAAASPVNGSAPQPEERPDQPGGEPGPAGA